MALALATSGCAAAEVPVASFPIEEVHDGKHWYFKKGSVAIEGAPCGEQYRRAVAGVPAAESEIHQCRTDNDLYYAGMVGFAAFPLAGLGIGSELHSHTAEAGVVTTAIALGVLSFAFAYWMDAASDRHLYRAVGFYNALRPVEPPP